MFETKKWALIVLSMMWGAQVSGSWNKLRNALVDVENFRIWWTGKDARYARRPCIHIHIL
jgi:hypothetical protein